MVITIRVKQKKRTENILRDKGEKIMVMWYNVVDAGTEEILYEDLKAGEIAKVIGIPSGYVSGYADKGFIYGQKYRIEKVGPIQNRLWQEWDKITSDLKRFSAIRRIRISGKVEE